MSNKVFIVLVVILSILIVCATIWLVTNIVEYNIITNSTENKLPEVSEEVNVATSQPTVKPTREIVLKQPTEKSKENNTYEYILPSDTKEITRSEIMKYDHDILNKAYNEIFARHGHDFKNKELKEYFNSQSWYKPVEGKTVNVGDLTELERKNMETIKARIDEIK